jgi:hypothetical protein
VIALRAGQSPALLVCDPDFQVVKLLYFLFVLCLLVFERVTLVHILFNYFLLSYSFSSILGGLVYALAFRNCSQTEFS